MSALTFGTTPSEPACGACRRPLPQFRKAPLGMTLRLRVIPIRPDDMVDKGHLPPPSRIGLAKAGLHANQRRLER